MTQESLEEFTFTVPLGLEAHRIAQQFCQQQSNQKKAKQIYLNTLAVSAVKYCLRCMGINTNLPASSSWNPVMQTLMDIADLEIPNIGKLECRPVLPEMQTIYIPPEVSSKRIGYVAVQFDQSLQKATLLGYTKTVPESGELSIAQLQPLENLLKYLHKIKYPEVAKTRVCLRQWFEGAFELGWQSLKVLLASEQNLGLNLRSRSRLGETMIKGAKLVDLGLQLEHDSLVLLIAIAPEPDGKVCIVVQLHPSRENYLPPDIELNLLFESETLQSVRSRTQDNYIQLKGFRGTPGECFNIQVASSHGSVTENFVI